MWVEYFFGLSEYENVGGRFDTSFKVKSIKQKTFHIKIFFDYEMRQFFLKNIKF